MSIKDIALAVAIGLIFSIPFLVEIAKELIK
jgi:hypothetical protein